MCNKDRIINIDDFRTGRKYEVALIALRLLGSIATIYNPNGMERLINEIIYHVESEGYKLNDYAEVITALSENLED